MAGSKESKLKPGPGNYEVKIDLRSSAPKYGFGTERRPEIARNKNSMPAPGQYTAKNFVGAEAKAVSMSPKLTIDYKVKNDKLVPGPGSYEFHLKAMKSSPNWGMGTSKRQANTSQGMKGVNTDPGAYNPTTTFTKSTAPNYRMGSETRKMFDDKKSLAVPGPGNYSLKSQAFEAGKGFGMGIKLKEAHSTRLNVPGAGSYEVSSPDKVSRKAPGYSMGAKLKSELVKDTRVPGPGAYQG